MKEGGGPKIPKKIDHVINGRGRESQNRQK